MVKTATEATDYAGFDAWLADKDSRKLANNTYVERVGDNIAVRLHATRIVTYHADGTITLDSGGWRTATTKERMHHLIGRLFLSSVDGVWTLTRRVGEWPAPCETVSEFYDGMRFTAAGEMVTAVLVDSGRELRKQKREISRYVKLYTDERIAELVADAAEHGTAGDCFYCGMVTVDSGQPLGDATGDNGHLLEHVREGYTMATLAANAVKSRGYREPAVILHHAPNLVRKAIRRYLVERLTTNHGARPSRDGLATHWG